MRTASVYSNNTHFSVEKIKFCKIVRKNEKIPDHLSEEVRELH